jgi:hypothetical protein
MFGLEKRSKISQIIDYIICLLLYLLYILYPSTTLTFNLLSLVIYTFSLPILEMKPWRGEPGLFTNARHKRNGAAQNSLLEAKS